MKIGILTGGGDCPGLNPAIRGFVMKGLDYGFTIYGIREGWKGLVKGIVEDTPLTVARVEEIISQGGTIIIISHRLSFVARSHQIIVVDQGRIAQIGTHDALLRGCLPYNQLWSQQARVYQ